MGAAKAISNSPNVQEMRRMLKNKRALVTGSTSESAWRLRVRLPLKALR